MTRYIEGNYGFYLMVGDNGLILKYKVYEEIIFLLLSKKKSLKGLSTSFRSVIKIQNKV